MHSEVMRAKLFNIRLSDEEWARVESLCEHYGLNAAGLFRMLLRKEEREVLDGDRSPAAKPSKPKKR